MNEMKNICITLIVPFYNESQRWNRIYWDELLGIPYLNWILINDGSTDGTKKLLESLANKNHVRVLSLSENLGKSEAIRHGLKHALDRIDLNQEINNMNLIGYMDGDGAFIKDDIERISKISLEKVSQNKSQDGKASSNVVDAVWSSRVALRGRQISREKYRHYLGRIVVTFLNHFVPEMPYDSQCGFKIFLNTKGLERCVHVPFETKWFIDIEIMLRWNHFMKNRINIWEEPLDTWREIPGSKLNLRSTITVLRDIFAIMVMRNKLKSTNSRIHYFAA